MKIFQINKKESFMIFMVIKDKDQLIKGQIQNLNLDSHLINLTLQMPRIFLNIFISKILLKMIFSLVFSAKIRTSEILTLRALILDVQMTVVLILGIVLVVDY